MQLVPSCVSEPLATNVDLWNPIKLMHEDCVTLCLLLEMSIML